MRKLWRDSLSQVPTDPEVCRAIYGLYFVDISTSDGREEVTAANGTPTAGNECYNV